MFSLSLGMDEIHHYETPSAARIDNGACGSFASVVTAIRVCKGSGKGDNTECGDMRSNQARRVEDDQAND